MIIIFIVSEGFGNLWIHIGI